MTLPTIEEARSWRGLTLVASGDEPVGRIDAVYLDRTTRQPEWVLVHTGLFGNSRTFVPLAGAAKLGDTVRVPHDLSVVRGAPRLEPDVDLSETDEARLYAHYGIDYTVTVSPSGLPATEAGGADATTEPPRPSATAWSTATPRLEADDVRSERRAGGRRRPALAAVGALALAAVGGGLAVLRARRRRPPSFGDRLAKAGRDAADTLTGTAGSIVRQAAAVGASDSARQAAAGGRRAAAGGAAAAAGGRRAARRASGTSLQAGKQAAAAAGGAARSVAGFPTAAGHRIQGLDLDRRGRQAREQARKAVPQQRRRRRSKMKVIGKLGMALGAAVGYVLGARAGRERYEQIAASARQLMEKPQVKRVMESAPGNLGARVEQVASKAADAVHQASDRVAPSGTGSGTTAEPAPAPSATGSGAETAAPRGAANTNRRSGGGSGSGSREGSKND